MQSASSAPVSSIGALVASFTLNPHFSAPSGSAVSSTTATVSNSIDASPSPSRAHGSDGVSFIVADVDVPPFFDEPTATEAPSRFHFFAP